MSCVSTKSITCLFSVASFILFHFFSRTIDIQTPQIWYACYGLKIMRHGAKKFTICGIFNVTMVFCFYLIFFTRKRGWIEIPYCCEVEKFIVVLFVGLKLSSIFDVNCLSHNFDYFAKLQDSIHICDCIFVLIIGINLRVKITTNFGIRIEFDFRVETRVIGQEIWTGFFRWFIVEISPISRGWFILG